MHVVNNMWLSYKKWLSTSHKLYVPALPETLPYLGIIEGSFDYVLPETILERLRQWLSSRGIASVFYFLTEGSPVGYPTDYEIDVSELTEKILSELNNGFENVLVGTDFSWALFMDHEGHLHVAGPDNLLACLQQWKRERQL